MRWLRLVFKNYPRNLVNKFIPVSLSLPLTTSSCIIMCPHHCVGNLFHGYWEELNESACYKNKNCVAPSLLEIWNKHQRNLATEELNESVCLIQNKEVCLLQQLLPYKMSLHTTLCYIESSWRASCTSCHSGSSGKGSS
jgi:hypothetical protein